MWDRDGEQNAYHAAQLVTVDLHTGEQRFHLPHRMCQLSDAFMKLHTGRLEQFRKPTLLKPGWRRTKWAGREWRPMVSFRLHGLGSGASGAATPSTTPMGDCAPPSLFMGATRPWHDGSAEVRTTRSRVLDALRHHLEAVGAAARAVEWLPNVTVHIESGTTTVPSVRPSEAGLTTAHLRAAFGAGAVEACSGGGRSTALIFRSPAFNLDPVNTYKQQANFQRRVRPMVEAAGGITFLDFYTATRDAALQNTPHAIRFDHFSTFHYFDAGRYLQAQTLLHALKLLNTLGSTGTAVPVTLGGG
jgi:hypothetical protein